MKNSDRKTGDECGRAVQVTQLTEETLLSTYFFDRFIKLTATAASASIENGFEWNDTPLY